MTTRLRMMMFLSVAGIVGLATACGDGDDEKSRRQMPLASGGVCSKYGPDPGDPAYDAGTADDDASPEEDKTN